MCRLYECTHQLQADRNSGWAYEVSYCTQLVLSTAEKNPQNHLESPKDGTRTCMSLPLLAGPILLWYGSRSLSAHIHVASKTEIWNANKKQTSSNTGPAIFTNTQVWGHLNVCAIPVPWNKPSAFPSHRELHLGIRSSRARVWTEVGSLVDTEIVAQWSVDLLILLFNQTSLYHYWNESKNTHEAPEVHAVAN